MSDFLDMYKLLILLVAPSGIEPELSALRGRRVNQLHHGAKSVGVGAADTTNSTRRFSLQPTARLMNEGLACVCDIACPNRPGASFQRLLSSAAITVGRRNVCVPACSGYSCSCQISLPLNPSGSVTVAVHPLSSRL